MSLADVQEKYAALSEEQRLCAYTDDYHRYSHYDLSGDVNAANRYILAARGLLASLPLSAAKGGQGSSEEVRLDKEALQKGLARAEDWIAEVGQARTRSSIQSGSFVCFR